jgi:hypothetical protein
MASDERSLAAVLLGELHDRETCIRVGGIGWAYPFVRYHDGQWQWAHYGKNGRVEGRVLDESHVHDLVDSKPIQFLGYHEAVGGLTDDGPTVWEDAAEQDVFTDADRCFWCGHSERTHDLGEYETSEDGDCLLCPDCFESFDNHDQIVGATDDTTEIPA